MEEKIKVGKREYTVRRADKLGILFCVVGFLLEVAGTFSLPKGVILIVLGIACILRSGMFWNALRASGHDAPAGRSSLPGQESDPDENK